MIIIDTVVINLSYYHKISNLTEIEYCKKYQKPAQKKNIWKFVPEKFNLKNLGYIDTKLIIILIYFLVILNI